MHLNGLDRILPSFMLVSSVGAHLAFQALTLYHGVAINIYRGVEGTPRRPA